MRALVIACSVWERDEYDTIGIPEQCAARGHDTDGIPAPTALANVQAIVTQAPDVVICRFGSDPEATTASSQLIDAGVTVIGGGHGVTTGDNHVLGLRAFRAAGVPVPDFRVIEAAEDAAAAADALGLPVVTKDPHTMAGVGVRMAHSVEDIDSPFASLRAGSPLLVERFYGECCGMHLRLFVVADEVDSARFDAKPGEFRTNALQGGRASAHQPKVEECRVAVGAATAIDLDIVGVDILPTTTGPRVIEANPNPRIAGIDGAAEAIVAYAERRVQLKLGRGE